MHTILNLPLGCALKIIKTFVIVPSAVVYTKYTLEIIYREIEQKGVLAQSVKNGGWRVASHDKGSIPRDYAQNVKNRGEASVFMLFQISLR